VSLLSRRARLIGCVFCCWADWVYSAKRIRTQLGLDRVISAQVGGAIQSKEHSEFGSVWQSRQYPLKKIDPMIAVSRSLDDPDAETLCRSERNTSTCFKWRSKTKIAMQSSDSEVFHCAVHTMYLTWWSGVELVLAEYVVPPEVYEVRRKMTFVRSRLNRSNTEWQRVNGVGGYGGFLHPHLPISIATSQWRWSSAQIDGFTIY